jgi:hypothetical protein
LQALDPSTTPRIVTKARRALSADFTIETIVIPERFCPWNLKASALPREKDGDLCVRRFHPSNERRRDRLIGLMVPRTVYLSISGQWSVVSALTGDFTRGFDRAVGPPVSNVPLGAPMC